MSFLSLSLHDFVASLACPEPTPGGGTAAAAAGAMGTALLMMVAGLSKTRGNTDEERATLAGARTRLAPIAEALEHAADVDAEAFNAVMAAYRLPKATDGEKAARKAAIAVALRGATDAPMETLRLAADALMVGEVVARLGNPSAASDAGVGGGLLAAAAEGAAANVRINLDGLSDESYRAEATATLEHLLEKARAAAAVIRGV